MWDGVELEEIPDDTEYIASFEVVGDDLISHFSHRNHTLRLQKDNIVHDKWLRFEACMYHVGFDPIYSCEECGFVLHEKCANLPMKKRLIFDIVPYTLGTFTGVFFIASYVKHYLMFSCTHHKQRISCMYIVVPFLNHLSMMAIYIHFIFIIVTIAPVMDAITLQHFLCSGVMLVTLTCVSIVLVCQERYGIGKMLTPSHFLLWGKIEQQKLVRHL